MFLDRLGDSGNVNSLVIMIMILPSIYAKLELNARKKKSIKQWRKCLEEQDSF